MKTWILPLALLVAFEAIADILAKEWEIRREAMLAIFSLLGYVIANSFWLFALKNGSGLARGGIIFSVSSAILAVVIGMFLYNETLTPRQCIGVGLGLLSLVLIF